MTGLPPRHLEESWGRGRVCEKGKALVVFKKKNRNQNKVDDGNIGNINDVTISVFFKWLQILVHVIRSLYIFTYIYIFRLFLIFPKIRTRVTETGDVYHSRNTSTNLTQQIDELKLFKKKNDLSIMKRPKCADIWFQLRCVPISCPRP